MTAHGQKMFAGKKVLIIVKDTKLTMVNAADDIKTKRLIREGATVVANVQPAHQKHHESLESAKRTLEKLGIEYQVVGMREKDVSLENVALVLAVGGDGTFLFASHHYGSGKVPLLGLNSDYPRSHGHFNMAHPENLEGILLSIFTCNLHPVMLTRLDLTLNGTTLGAHPLNEVYVGHHFSAGTSRYMITIDGITERQRSCGVLIGTPSGSTGWLDSEGGSTQPITARAFQYLVRGLIVPIGANGQREKFRLYRDVLADGMSIKIVSGSDDNVLAIDGEHIIQEFGLGDELVVTVSDRSLPAYVDFRAHDIYSQNPYQNGIPQRNKPQPPRWKRWLGLA